MRLLIVSIPMVITLASSIAGCSSSSDGGGDSGAGGQSGLLGAWFVADGFCGNTATHSNGMELRADGTFVSIQAGVVGGVDQWRLEDGTYCTSTTDWSGTYTWDGKVFAGTAKGAVEEPFSGPFERGPCTDGACTAQAKFTNDPNLDFDDFMNNQSGLWCQKPKRTATGNCP